MDVNIAFAGDTVPCSISPDKYFAAFTSIVNHSELKDIHKLVFNLKSVLIKTNDIPLETGSSRVFGDKSVFDPTIAHFRDILMCSTANNHFFDYGPAALTRTIEYLDHNEIPNFGSGKNESEASSPYILKHNGVSLGFISICSPRKCVGDHLSVQAANNIALVNDSVPRRISKLKPQVDHIIVICHWGKEFVHYPLPEDVQLARSFIDAGASLVVGHHPHVLQGYERYKNGYIAYSLGNFLFPDQTDPQPLRWNKNEKTGMIIRVAFSKKNISEFSIVPVYLASDNSFSVLTDPTRAITLNKIDRWSKALSRPDYAQFFDREMRLMVIRKLVAGFFRNILHPRKSHFVMLFRMIKQLLLGKRYYVHD